MATPSGSVTIRDGFGNKVVATDGLNSPRSLVITFTTDASGNCVWSFVDQNSNVLALNALLMGEQFTLGSATGYSAQLQLGIGAEDLFVGQGASIAGTVNKHGCVTVTDGTNTGVAFPPIIGQPTLSVSGGGNVKTGTIQLFLKLLG